MSCNVLVDRRHRFSLESVEEGGKADDPTLIRRVRIRLQITTQGRRPEIKAKRRLVTAAAAAAATTVKETTMILPVSLCNMLRGKLFGGGRYYAFLFTHSLRGKKTDTFIGCGTNPMHELWLRNNQLSNDRATNSAAPYWTVSRVLGPFNCFEKAVACTQDWVSGTRGKVSKCNKAEFLARIYDVDLYTSEKRDDESPFGDYLRRVAPACYVQTYERMCEQRGLVAV